MIFAWVLDIHIETGISADRKQTRFIVETKAKHKTKRSKVKQTIEKWQTTEKQPWICGSIWPGPFLQRIRYAAPPRSRRIHARFKRPYVFTALVVALRQRVRRSESRCCLSHVLGEHWLQVAPRAEPNTQRIWAAPTQYTNVQMNKYLKGTI